ncbi:MAG TPA: hypothetical protein VFJ57_13270 [Solirubrobacterales bacterium]|nr:hypothetical protein [Solirubrobacterales bacterium]
MESEERKAGFAYSLALVIGLFGLIGLGLLGLPMTTLILVAFASTVLGAFAYGLWDVLAHRKPRSRLRSSA